MTKTGIASRDEPKQVPILCLPCAKLEDHPLHMEHYGESHLTSLVESIQEVGLLEPLVVHPLAGGHYRILSGHYRVRAVRRLRWKHVMCQVLDCDAQAAIRMYCVSNLLNRSVSPLEEAILFSRLVMQEQHTLAAIGKIWGRSKSWVSRRLALLTHLDPQLKKALEQGCLSPRMAQELLRLPQGNDQERVWTLIRRHHLNKDAAAQLITDWLTADEPGKQARESQPPCFLQGFSGDRPTMVRAQLTQCIRLLEKLIRLAQTGADGWREWPMPEYQAYLQRHVDLEEELSFQRRNPCAAR